MALVEKPDPRRKLMLAVVLDFLIIALGVALYLNSGNMVWIIGGAFVASAVAAPLVISAMREMKEQNNASG
ncbi:MAG: hypothetical protein AAGL99_10880 [Pseudomonadota bacterium]